MLQQRVLQLALLQTREQKQQQQLSRQGSKQRLVLQQTVQQLVTTRAVRLLHMPPSLHWMATQTTQATCLETTTLATEVSLLVDQAGCADQPSAIQFAQPTTAQPPKHACMLSTDN
jgi:hypothetical protein